jgi:hypothetical protein
MMKREAKIRRDEDLQMPGDAIFRNAALNWAKVPKMGMDATSQELSKKRFCSRRRPETQDFQNNELIRWGISHLIIRQTAPVSDLLSYSM